MKPKTNRQVLAAAVKQLSDIDLVFLRERLLTSCDQILSNQEQFVADTQQSIVSPHLVIECMQNIKEAIDFDR